MDADFALRTRPQARGTAGQLAGAVGVDGWMVRVDCAAAPGVSLPAQAPKPAAARHYQLSQIGMIQAHKRSNIQYQPVRVGAGTAG